MTATTQVLDSVSDDTTLISVYLEGKIPPGNLLQSGTMGSVKNAGLEYWVVGNEESFFDFDCEDVAWVEIHGNDVIVVIKWDKVCHRVC